MKFGVTMFATDRSASVPDVARAAEERGFASLWLPEHTHIPVSRRTPPPTGDAVLAEEYKRTVDPLVALGAAAAVTSTLRLGTGIALPAQREPLVTAKALATLDLLSGGRVDFGVGYGWNADELEQHGVAMPARRAVVRERVLAMQALWRDDVAAFHGEHVTIEPSWSWPKPLSHRVPVLLGGAPGPTLFAHIAEFGDGWIPVGGAGVADSLPALRAACDAAGREWRELRIVPFGSFPTAGKLDHYARAGATECVFRLPSAGLDEVREALDEWSRVVATWSAGASA